VRNDACEPTCEFNRDGSRTEFTQGEFKKMWGGQRWREGNSEEDLPIHGLKKASVSESYA
jgi:hypothetical protein